MILAYVLAFLFVPATCSDIHGSKARWPSGPAGKFIIFFSLACVIAFFCTLQLV